MIHKTIVFASYELAPINAGGCGVFIWNAANELLRDPQVRIVLLLDMPKHECEQFVNVHKHNLPNHHHLEVICLSEYLSGKTDIDVRAFQNIYLSQSYRFYAALDSLIKSQNISLVEFFDYVGIGYFSILAKKYEGKFPNTILSVRAHCTIDLMDMNQVQADLRLEKIEMYEMEKVAIRESDCLLVPSEAWAEIYQRRYGVAKHKTVVSVPPLYLKKDLVYQVTEDKQDVLFYGRIFQLKGVDNYVDAALTYLYKHPKSKTTFYLAGYDSQLNGISYKDRLLQRIPSELRSRFVFTGQLEVHQLQELLQRIRFAVFPNHVESFCYSIHELYEAGLPVICNAIPAFVDYFEHEKNCLQFDGNITDLARQMERLFTDDSLLKKLSKPYTVIKNESFVSTYRSVLNGVDLHTKDDNTPMVCNNATVSVIAFSDNRASLVNKFNKYETVDLNRSYYLSRTEAGIPINFLGESWNVCSIGHSLEAGLGLCPYFIMLGHKDDVQAAFLNRALKIMQHQPGVAYVGSMTQDDGRTLYPKVQLHRVNPYQVPEVYGRNFLFRSPLNTNLLSLFDTRLSSFGYLQMLKQDGYVIPERLMTMSLPNMTGQAEVLAFAVHHQTQDQQWNPFLLYPFVFKERDYTVSKHTNDNLGFKRVVYYALRDKASKMSGFRGKAFNRIINFAYKLLK